MTSTHSPVRIASEIAWLAEGLELKSPQIKVGPSPRLAANRNTWVIISDLFETWRWPEGRYTLMIRQVKEPAVQVHACAAFSKPKSWGIKSGCKATVLRARIAIPPCVWRRQGAWSRLTVLLMTGWGPIKTVKPQKVRCSTNVSVWFYSIYVYTSTVYAFICRHVSYVWY